MTRDRGQIVTFYSFKGGVGRSMALANVAAVLAQRGKKVLVLDFDFEAPGLHRYFLNETDQDPSLGGPRFTPARPQKGVIDLFMALRKQLRAHVPVGQYPLDDPAARPLLRTIVAKLLRSKGYRYRVNLWNPNNKETVPIDFVAAGRFERRYVERVRAFNWRRFYIIPPESLRDPRRNVSQAHDIAEESASRISEAERGYYLRISGLSTDD